MGAGVVGIDLGTTFSAIAAVNAHGRPEIISNRDGESITPSVVMFDAGATLVGSIAKRNAVANPENVVQFVKRQMGNPAWRYPSPSGVTYSSEDVSALILKKLKDDAELVLGPIVDAVISVPAYFTDAQRRATQDAGAIAGLNVLRIVNEPTAAALAYGLDHGAEQKTVLVYDLGGGTFDVTIMRVGGGRLDVLATDGARNLGGFDFDNEVINFLNDEFMKAGGPSLLEDPTLAQDLRDRAEGAKHALSTRDRTAVYLSAAGKSATVELTLERFDALTQSLVDRTGRIMKLVLEDAGLRWSSLDKILLVGGSTRMRAIPAVVEAISGMKPSRELHPDLVVAMGAAIQGELLRVAAGRSALVERGSFPLVEVLDITAHSLGVIAHDDRDRPHNAIVLKRNTKYGTAATEVFQTVEDGQTGVRVQITQGESDDPAYVHILHEEPISIPPYPRGAPLRVTFTHTLDGTVHVAVFDLTANRPIAGIQVKNPSNMPPQRVAESRARIAPMKLG